MPIGRPKMVKCKNCKKRFMVMIGDVRPQRITCMHCGFVWFYTGM